MNRNNEIANAVIQTLDRYFEDLEGQKVNGIYDMVMRNTERPLLECVMKRTQGNQSEAAHLLGINRNTLRRKLVEHGLLGNE